MLRVGCGELGHLGRLEGSCREALEVPETGTGRTLNEGTAR